MQAIIPRTMHGAGQWTPRPAAGRRQPAAVYSGPSRRWTRCKHLGSNDLSGGHGTVVPRRIRAPRLHPARLDIHACTQLDWTSSPQFTLLDTTRGRARRGQRRGRSTSMELLKGIITTAASTGGGALRTFFLACAFTYYSLKCRLVAGHSSLKSGRVTYPYCTGAILN